MRLPGLLIVVLILFTTSISKAQQNSYNPVPNIMSPDVATLGKYGTYHVNYYTGTPDISIPLHVIKESGLEVPVSLSYDASGFIPNKNAGIVGLNWNLIAGGAVTRVVNGVPDDKYNPNSEPANTHIGYIYGQQHGLGTYTREHMRTIGFISNISVPVYNLNYEYIPDVFTFNFLGHSGKFFMDNSGQVRVTGDRNYKVDLTNLKPQYDFLTTVAAVTGTLNQLNSALYSQIVITSDDGYTFYFGGAFKTLEISFSSNQFPGIPDRKGGQINAWHLTKAVSPDGNEILFNYLNYTNDDYVYIQNLFNSQNGSWKEIPAGFMELKLYRNHSIHVVTRGGNTIQNENTQSAVNASLIKHAYLAEIKSRMQTVKFYYVAKDLATKFYGNPSSIISGGMTLGSIIRNLHTKRLISIYIQDNFGENPVVSSKSIELYHNYFGNRLFLTDLEISEVGNVSSPMRYGFTYNNTSELPVPLTRGIDLWGYYNGRNGNTDLVVVPVTSSSEYESNPAHPSAYRLADPAYAAYGLLNTITYPTGGATQFTFEANTYSKALKRKVSSGIEPVWETENGTAGGARVQQIKNTPGTTTTFKYITDYELNINNPSSGLLSESGIYFLDYVAGGERVIRITDNNIAPASSYRESHIAYKEVVEINSEGFTKHKFTNHETNPDTYFLGNDSYKITTEVSSTNFNQQLKRLYRYSSREDERGKPLKMEVYDSGKVIRKSVEYQYNTDLQRDTANTIAHYSPFGFTNWSGNVITIIQSYALYHYQNHTTRILEKDYGASAVNPLTQTTTFAYKSNTNRLLTEKTITRSDGDTLISKYKYPADFAPTEPYATMVNSKHMLTPLVEQQEYKGTALFLQSTKTNYASWNSGANIKPSSIEQKIGAANAEVRALFSAYDNKGNLLSWSKDGAVNPVYTSYIWGYNQTLPIAAVTNAGSDQVAFTSFEAGGKGNWTYSGTVNFANPSPPSGMVMYTLATGNITKSGLLAGTVYIVSYWTKNAVSFTITGTTGIVQGKTIKGWTFFEHTITGQTTITVSGTGDIDDLRLYPAGSLMTTYTYSGFGNMTSQSDANNRITYYEYDGAGRLLLIKDQDRNIIKRYCYNFFGEPANCAPLTFSNTAKSQSFTRNNCPAGQVGSSVLYTVPDSTYQSTIDQLDADEQAQHDIDMNGQNYADTVGTCSSVPVTVTLKNDFYNHTAPPNQVEFIQNGTVIQTNSFPTGQKGFLTISVPSGAYQLRFTVPSAHAFLFLTYVLTPGDGSYWWDKNSNQTTITTQNVTISAGTIYTITVSDNY